MVSTPIFTPIITLTSIQGQWSGKRASATLRDLDVLRLRTELDEPPSQGIVALLQIDIYMMGRPNPNGIRSLSLAEGTLDIATGRMWRDHGIHVILSLNNAENAFTPQACSDLSGSGAISSGNRGSLCMWLTAWFPG